MKLTRRIIAVAPTAYQSMSLSKFCLNNKKMFDGSIVGTMDFFSEEEAKQYLMDRAYKYYDDSGYEVDPHLETIEKFGILNIDAVTARIVEISDEEE